uniref:Uncharacterized protein n=1 Tax=Glossina austeni TaxID=7395 RepID=A0A1A9UIZ8_GLOAU
MRYVRNYAITCSVGLIAQHCGPTFAFVLEPLEAAGFSASSMGGPVGRGSLLRHNCMRKFCITDSRSCKAERNSLDSLRFDRVVSVPHSEAPLRRLPVVAFCDIAISSIGQQICVGTAL